MCVPVPALFEIWSRCNSVRTFPCINHTKCPVPINIFIPSRVTHYPNSYCHSFSNVIYPVNAMTCVTDPPHLQVVSVCDKLLICRQAFWEILVSEFEFCHCDVICVVRKEYSVWELPCFIRWLRVLSGFEIFSFTSSQDYNLWNIATTLRAVTHDAL